MAWTADQIRMLREIGVGWIASSHSASPAAVRSVAQSVAHSTAGPTLPPRSASPSLPEAETRSAPSPFDASATIGDPASRLQSPDGLSQLGWPALQQAVAQCQACMLCETRTQTVFGVGSQQAHWLIVGEAPGEQEDLKGQPFVGASGRLLDNMLHAVGLTRQATTDSQPSAQVYITNTLKCRPPGNRNPQAEELSRCEPFLARQLDLLQPRIIVLMGRFAIAQLLRSTEPVGKLRGRVHRYAGVPLVVTYHPAYLLRNPLDKGKAWSDWCLAAHTYAGLAHV